MSGSGDVTGRDVSRPCLPAGGSEAASEHMRGSSAAPELTLGICVTERGPEFYILPVFLVYVRFEVESESNRSSLILI